MVSISVSKFDKAVINFVSRLPSGLRPVFAAMSYIGHPITTSLIGGTLAIYGILQHHPAVFWSGSLIWVALGISTILKHVVERSRPITSYVARMRIPSFSFPSGHTTGSTVAFGLLAYYAYHLLLDPFSYILLVLFIGLIFLVGVSRIYLGAHYPTDVAGGWTLGVVFLYIALFIIKPLS
jgi:undecaprenyl-diphosphatase